MGRGPRMGIGRMMPRTRIGIIAIGMGGYRGHRRDEAEQGTVWNFSIFFRIDWISGPGKRSGCDVTLWDWVRIAICFI